MICAALTATSVADAAPDSGGLRSGAEWIRQGNAHLAAGAYAKALAAFDKAREVLPDSAEAAYDRGIALFRLGRFDEAETAFQDALASAKPALEAAAKYNLGRSAHQAAIQREKDLKAAINDLTRAVGFYKDALQLRPGDADARENLAKAERTRAYIKKLLEQQQKQQKQQEGDDEGKADDKSDATSQPGEQKESATSRPDDDSREGEEQPSEKSEAKESKPDADNRESEQAPDQPPPPTTQPADREPTSQPTTQPMNPQTTQPASQPTSRPAPVTSRPEDPDALRERMSRERAMQMLQEARDAERLRRAQKREQRLRTQGRIRVDKDW